MKDLNSLCFFSSYLVQERIPDYVKFYLNELSRHFDKLIFIVNDDNRFAEKDLEWLSGNKIGLFQVENKGFDFGMYFKAVQKFDLKDYDRLGLVNDSCILFRKLDFVFDYAEKADLDYSGMVDSNEIHYHVQSFFLLLNRKAIRFFLDYLRSHGVLTEIMDVIKTYEVGLSGYLLENNCKIGALFSYKDIAGCDKINPTYAKIEALLDKGIPLIKKRIIQKNFNRYELKKMLLIGYNPDPAYYINKIKRECLEGNEMEVAGFFDEIASGVSWRYSALYCLNTCLARLHMNLWKR